MTTTYKLATAKTTIMLTITNAIMIMTRKRTTCSRSKRKPGLSASSASIEFFSLNKQIVTTCSQCHITFF